MKAINYLKQIKIMDAKINALQEELEMLEALATRTTSVLGGERVQTSGNKDNIGDCTVKIAEMKHQINLEIDSLYDYKEEAWKLISECDAECITLISKRYFQFKTWESIAVDMNFTYQWVSGGLHQKALAQVQKSLDERMGKINE